MSTQQELSIQDTGVSAVQRLEGLPENASLAQILRLALVDERITAEKIERLLAIQERAEDRMAEREFIAARARLKFPPIVKTRKGHNSNYAPYEEVQEIIDPILAAEGFTLSFGSGHISDKGMIPIEVTLSHSLGHKETKTLELPADKSGSMNAIQGAGSTFSYGQRYAAKMILNLRFIGEDDDGNAASYIDQEQVDDLDHKVDMCSTSDKGFREKFLAFMNVKTISDITKGAYAPAINFLNAKLRKEQK